MRYLKVVSFIMSCFFSTFSLGGDIHYKVGPHGFKVPQENTLNSTGWRWLRSMIGLDESVGSFMFTIDPILSEVDSNNSRTVRNVNKITGSVYLVNSVERERLNDFIKLADLWNARNGYERREVVFDEASGYYFIFEREGYRGIFYVFSQSPSSEMPPNKDEFYIAICSGSSITEIRHASCKIRLFIAPDLQVNFSIPFEHIGRQERVKACIKNSLLKWLE